MNKTKETMPTKEGIKLAPAVVEALEKLGKECVVCEGRGYMIIHNCVKCTKCNGTGKVGDWKWRPKVGDSVVIDGHLNILVETCYMEDYPYRTSTEETFNEWDIKEGKAILLPHWEDDIEPILEKAGYGLLIDTCPIGQMSDNRRGKHYVWIYKSREGQVIKPKGWGETRQLAVMRAVVQLSEKTENSKC